MQLGSRSGGWVLLGLLQLALGSAVFALLYVEVAGKRKDWVSLNLSLNRAG
jgi:hypothetical protein